MPQYPNVRSACRFLYGDGGSYVILMRAMLRGCRALQSFFGGGLLVDEVVFVAQM